jgi:hypothetical protein
LADLKIKAVSPDNAATLRGIVQLFRELYGDTYSTMGVYDVDYWRTNVGRRLTSLAVSDHGEIVAHLALVRLGAGAADVFVTHAALHPRYQHHGGEITGLTRDVVRRLGIRQQWGSTLACLHETAVPTGQFAATVLRSREVAILPDYFQYGSGTAQRRRHGLLTHRSFGRDRFPGATVYLPERHREIARILYAPLGLERQIADPAQPKRVVTAPPWKSVSPVPVERVPFRSHGSYHLLVSPQRFDPRRPIEPRSWNGSAPVYVYLDSFDPACPVVAEHLEAQGYRFGGVVPAVFGHDSIFYFKETEPYVDRSPFSTARARMLSRYIEDYDLGAALDVVIPQSGIVTVSAPPTGRPHRSRTQSPRSRIESERRE